MLRRRLTPKQRVLKVYPEAFSWCWAGKHCWVIYRPLLGGNDSLNSAAETAAQAWAEAWKNVRTNKR